MVSGYAKPVEGILYVPDLYPDRGSLSGIHAGLLAIKNASDQVLAVDTPLLPAELQVLLHEKAEKGFDPLLKDAEWNIESQRETFDTIVRKK